MGKPGDLECKDVDRHFTSGTACAFQAIKSLLHVTPNLEWDRGRKTFEL